MFSIIVDVKYQNNAAMYEAYSTCSFDRVSKYIAINYASASRLTELTRKDAPRYNHVCTDRKSETGGPRSAASLEMKLLGSASITMTTLVGHGRPRGSTLRRTRRRNGYSLGG